VILSKYVVMTLAFPAVFYRQELEFYNTFIKRSVISPENKAVEAFLPLNPLVVT